MRSFTTRTIGFSGPQTCKWGRYCYRPHCTGCVDRRYAFRGRLSPGARAGIRFRREEKVTRRPLFRPAVPRSETCVRASTGSECEHSVTVRANRLSGLPITRPSMPFGSRSAWGPPICIESLFAVRALSGQRGFRHRTECGSKIPFSDQGFTPSLPRDQSSRPMTESCAAKVSRTSWQEATYPLSTDLAVDDGG